MAALETWVLSLCALAPSLGGLWGMFSIQAHIRPSAQEMQHKHKQSILKFPNISNENKQTQRRTNNSQVKTSVSQNMSKAETTDLPVNVLKCVWLPPLPVRAL